MAALLSDEILIQEALAGKQAAFAMLVNRYEKYVFTLALRLVKQREDAHEVAQDTFLRAFKYLDRFKGTCRFSTWLYKIVYSVALNHMRKFSPDLRSLDDETKPLQLPDEAVSDAAWALEKNDRNARLQQAIAQLLPDDANVITLFYLYEQSLEEICMVTDLSMSNAKTKLCRARQRLKVIMQEQFAGEFKE